MARVTDEQIRDARKITLLAHFEQTNPGVLRHKYGRIVHKDHDSFVIDNGSGGWFWNSKGVGGLGLLDYMMRIEGKGFLDAVNELTGGSIPEPVQYKARTPPASSKAAKPKESSKPAKSFALPKPGFNNDNMIAYLRSRGISENTTRKYINQGLLYESASKNCVFVGRDTQDGNKPKCAAERSVTRDEKKYTAGSDMAYNFCLPPDNPANANTAAIFESPIDALSHHDILKIAEAESGTSWDGYRLSLGGTASVSLNSFLERHPHVQNIFLCLDSDNAGIKATERITKELLTDKRFAGKNIIIAPPPIGKDFNETLSSMRQLIRERDRPEKHNTREPRQKQAGISI